MTVYATQIGTAFDVLSRKGAPITIHKIIGGTYDRLHDTTAGATPAQTQSYAVKLPATVANLGVLSQAIPPGTFEKREVALFIVAALGMSFRPESNDVADFAGTSWDILGVEPLEPDGEPILYRFVAAN
jgi:hypothetical protein